MLEKSFPLNRQKRYYVDIYFHCNPQFLSIPLHRFHHVLLFWVWSSHLCVFLLHKFCYMCLQSIGPRGSWLKEIKVCFNFKRIFSLLIEKITRTRIFVARLIFVVIPITPMVVWFDFPVLSTHSSSAWFAAFSITPFGPFTMT